MVLDGMTYNSHSESLEDNEATRKRFLWDKMIPSLWLLFILLWSFPSILRLIPFLLLWLLYILKLSERKQALIYACRSRGGLDRVAFVIEEYMKFEYRPTTNNSDPQNPNPTSMTTNTSAPQDPNHTTMITNNSDPQNSNPTTMTMNTSAPQDPNLTTTITINSDPQNPSPTTMTPNTSASQSTSHTTIKGYNYLVGVMQALEQVVPFSPPRHGKRLDLSTIATVKKIWECQGSLLGQHGDPDGKLKDKCLSFSLFWLLLRRFADYDLGELSSAESREKTWNFVRYGLINEQDEGNEERAFSVVEVELQYLSDFFFTNYFAVYCKGPRFLLVRVTVFVLYLVVSFAMLRILSYFKIKSKHWYDINNLQIRVTQVIIWILTLVELAQLTNLITSRWNKVKWICSYVQKRWWDAGLLGRCKAKLLHILCRAPCFQPWINPWHRKLGQYSLLDSYGHKSKILMFKGILDGFMEFPMKGQKKITPIKLSKEVKKAVVISLRTNGRRLSNGVASLRRLNQDTFSWACTGNKSSTRTILVWHIATSMCEISPSLGAEYSEVDFRVATSLSKYCAYLVVFAPQLLPDHVYIAQCAFEEVVFEAIEKFKDCHSKEALLKELDKLCPMSDNATTTLEQGASLGRGLREIDAGGRWKVLAEVWAEMILFLAPSGHAAAQAEHLATGGEFITHLWALLTHAGIVG